MASGSQGRATPFKKSEWGKDIEIKDVPQICLLEKWFPAVDGVSGGCRTFRRCTLVGGGGFWELEGYSMDLTSLCSLV